ncbi:unnamed protein product [Arctogadus glacialis]
MQLLLRHHLHIINLSFTTDNAYDPDVNAKQIWINKTQMKDMECLTFSDDGNGLSRDLMHQMLSFGFSEKKAVNGKHSIGIYCNGFKSGSMRLGQDAIVLSKSNNDVCWHAVTDFLEEDLSQAHGCAYHQL